MKCRKIIKMIFVIPLLFLACESVVDVDLPKQESKIVVNSFFTPDSSWRVNVSKSLGTFDYSNTITEQYGYKRKIIPEISNANVEIWEEENFIAKLNYNVNGFYTADNIYPELNKTYQIKVSADNFKSVTSYSSVPIATEILNVRKKIIMNSNHEESLELEISFEDENEVENYYNLSIFHSSMWGNQYLWFESNDIVFSGNSQFIFEDQSLMRGEAALFDDVIFDGEEYTITIDCTALYYEDYGTSYLILSSLSKELYTYLKSVKAQEEAQDNPFSEPVFIHGNIEGGLGIFGGYNSTYYKLN